MLVYAVCMYVAHILYNVTIGTDWVLQRVSSLKCNCNAKLDNTCRKYT